MTVTRPYKAEMNSRSPRKPPILAQKQHSDSGHDIIYGLHAVEAALSNPKRRVRSLAVTKNGFDRLKEAVPELAVEPEVLHPRDLDRRLEPGAVHQGVLLLADPLPQPRLDQIERSGIVVVLDQVTDPHNVGAILRSCAAFRVTALVTTARHAPSLTAVLFKSASGAAEAIPFVRVTNLARAIEELKSYDFEIMGLDSDAPQAIQETAPRFPVALVLGAEGKGLRHLTRQSCDRLVRLELPGVVKSLNVSNAAAVALYALSTANDRPSA